MKLIYKGKFRGEAYLKKADLPSNAVKFKEPDTPKKLNLVASLFIIPCVILIGIIIYIATLVNGGVNQNSEYTYFIFPFLCSLLTVLPHELLHAVCMGKDAEVELYYSLKNMMAFVATTHPISKKRFIFMSLLPNLVFGWIPLLVWAFIPLSVDIANFLLKFSILCILLGVGDYLNIWNAFWQMPKGSVQVLSGFNSYWYMPEKKDVYNI